VKTTSIALFLTLATLATRAQVLIGPVAGPQLTWIRYEQEEARDAYTVSPLLRYHVGGMVSFRVRNRFFLNTSVLYSRKAKSLKVKDDETFQLKSAASFIDVPILYTAEFRAKLKGNKSFKYYLGLGPDIAFWLGGRGTLTTTDVIEQGLSEVDFKIRFRQPLEQTTNAEMTLQDPNRVQLGINIVAGVAFEPLGFNKTLITLRYAGGHSYLGKSNGVFPVATDYTDIMQARNKVVTLSFAYLIDLKIDQRMKGKSTINKKKL
jgi:hypothetical protein